MTNWEDEEEKQISQVKKKKKTTSHSHTDAVRLGMWPFLDLKRKARKIPSIL